MYTVELVAAQDRELGDREEERVSCRQQAAKVQHVYRLRDDTGWRINKCINDSAENEGKETR